MPAKRCPEFWEAYWKWIKAENEKSLDAEKTLAELREHLNTCLQCLEWWKVERELVRGHSMPETL